jgi:alginate O-acetyltransferase complex protein AlgI
MLRVYVRKPPKSGLMLFNSYAFIFLFLPIVLAGYFWLGRGSNLAPVIWLAAASLVFYSVSNWQFVALLLASIAFNYLIGYLLIAAKLTPVARFAALTVGVAGDLLVLAIFKYAGFFASNLNALFATHFVVNILLPVGISFPSRRSRSWSMLTGVTSRAMRCRITRCS